MVKILANGDIVQDDDPRAQRPSSSYSDGQRRQGGVQHTDYDQGQGAPGGQQVSVFSQLNERLVGAGLPRLDIGAWGSVEPIVYVGFLIAFLLIGWNGLIFALLLFGVSRWSSMSGGGGGGSGGGGRSREGTKRRGWAAKGGHRLNR